MSYLLDTNVVSEIRKSNRADKAVMKWFSEVSDDDLHIPAIDGLLAATALVHDLTLVTRNTRDVARTGARLLDPFASVRR